MMQHQANNIERKINTALLSLRKVMDQQKEQPVLASSCDHTYDDKFALAEEVVTLAVASFLGVLEGLGLDRASIVKLAALARTGRHVTLRLRSEEACKFIKQEKREVESDFKVQKDSTLFGKSETKVVRTETDYHWSISHTYEVVAFTGAHEESDTKITLGNRSATCEIVTRSDRPPRAEFTPKQVDCDITWPLSQLQASDGTEEAAAPRLTISIDRSDSKCLTPRRNPLVDDAMKAFKEFHGGFCNRLHSLYGVSRSIEEMHAGQTPNKQYPTLQSFATLQSGGEEKVGLFSHESVGLFISVLPLMQKAAKPAAEAEEEAPATETLVDVGDGIEEAQPAAAATTTTQGFGQPPPSPVLRQPSCQVVQAVEAGKPAPVTLSATNMELILKEERDQIAQRKALLSNAFPPADTANALLTVAEAWLATLALHSRHTIEQFEEAMNYIESLLRNQLISAIGKEVTAEDFTAYMRHHSHKLFKPSYTPQPFCFAVRQVERSPEGTISIEMPVEGTDQPIETITRTMEQPSPPMTFALDAATKVTFHGERHLHAFIAHDFGGRGRGVGRHMELAMRARQFSSFLVLIGRLGPGGTFEPKHGLILRNKDDVKIPLMLEQMPSAKEFKDAIASLSPEQQRFAKAYRSMQLEGSVFGVLVIQLKPQLERLLRLPPDSLTKEIALNEKLLELFIEYQIPSDLLAYDGPSDAPVSEKLKAVTTHVQAIYDTLEEAKKAEVDAEKQKHAYSHPEWNDGVPMAGGLAPPPLPAGGLFGSAPAPMPAYAASASMMASGSMGACPPPMARGKGGGCPKSACAMRSAARSAPPPPPPPQMAAACCASDAPSCESAASNSAPSKPASKKPSSQQSFDDEMVDLGSTDGSGSYALDYTRLPAELDAKLEALDVDAALRPTKINVEKIWTKRSQPALLAKPSSKRLADDAQESEKQKAFDLLDALSRSGSLPIDCCSLHVLIAATHCFDDSLIDTVIVKNVNPIEKLERSMLIVSETIQGVAATQLVRGEVYDRVAEYSAPALLPPRIAREVSVSIAEQ